MLRGDIVVVDYQKGNLQSVVRAVNAVGGNAFASADPADIAAASAVILPGVGSFEDAMASLKASGQADAIVETIAKGTPFLGICLGLQVLFTRGAEHAAASSFGGEWVPGLGVLRGSVTRLESDRLKVPHVGWDQAHLTEHAHALRAQLRLGRLEGQRLRRAVPSREELPRRLGSSR